MNHFFASIKPRWIPPLDPGFIPAALAYRAFQQDAARDGTPLVIGLERGSGEFSRYETRVFPEGHPRFEENFYQVERLVKFLLWQRGGYRVLVGGPHRVGEFIQQTYSAAGPRRFDQDFMGRQVYEQPFQVELCGPQDVPAGREAGRPLGHHLKGCRIGFDLGASDRKVSAVIDGQVIFSEEVIWEPRKHSDPEYHYRELLSAIQSAAVRLPRVDAIGGSSAGIIIHNRPMVASLFRAVPPERFGEIRSLFLRIGAEMRAPIEVINDGDVTALAGAMSLEDNGILGIALGSSQAAGYIDLHGHILNWLSELAFAPVDYNPQAPQDEWSGDRGCGAQYFSQQFVFRLAPLAGIDIPGGITDAEKLAHVQKLLEAGHAGAAKIWQSMGIYLGYGLAHYANFYELKHVLILGRCTSGQGGDLLLLQARQVLEDEFPELAARIHVELPSEKNRRVGQSIAAASLPEIETSQE